MTSFQFVLLLIVGRREANAQAFFLAKKNEWRAQDCTIPIPNWDPAQKTLVLVSYGTVLCTEILLFQPGPGRQYSHELRPSSWSCFKAFKTRTSNDDYDVNRLVY